MTAEWFNWRVLKIVVSLVYLFILTPLVITFLVGFNANERALFPPQGFSLAWWNEALSSSWLLPIWFSIKMSLATACVAILIGLPLAYALFRYRFLGRNVVMMLVLSPLVLPGLVTGLATLFFFATLKLTSYLGLWSLVAAHTAVSMPILIRIIWINLESVSVNLERAAASLGASRAMVHWRITLPMIRNGIVSGGVFAFIHAFTDVNVSLFLARPGQSPITIRILSQLESGFTPTIAAVGVLTMLIPMLMIIAVERVSGLSNFVYGGAK